MKRLLLPLLVLTACSSTQSAATTNQALQNPLFAERYAEEILDRFSTLEVIAAPGFEDEAVRQTIESERTKWRAIAKEASQKRFDGRYGGFAQANSEDYAAGGVLLYEDTLYVSSDFEVYPSPKLAFYFSTSTDPRETEFPTETDVRFVSIGSPYGMREYPVESVPEDLRSVVIYDELLGRIIAFAQL